MSQEQLAFVQLGLKAPTFISADEPFDDRLSFLALGASLLPGEQAGRAARHHPRSGRPGH